MCTLTFYASLLILWSQACNIIHNNGGQVYLDGNYILSSSINIPDIPHQVQI